MKHGEGGRKMRMHPVMIAIAAFTGIALGTILLAIAVTFRATAEFPILMGGIVLLILLIGIDYWQWMHREP
jgi:hypothetical protein